MNISKEMITNYLKKVEQVLIEHITDKSPDTGFTSGKVISTLETGIDLGVLKHEAYLQIVDFSSAQCLLFKFYNKKKREIISTVKSEGRERIQKGLTDEAMKTLKGFNRSRKQEVNND